MSEPENKEGPRVIACIPVRAINRAGLPSQHHWQLEGKSVLEWVVEKAGRCQKISDVFIVTDIEDDPEIKRCQNLGAHVEVSRQPDIPQRQVLRQARKFHRHGWRGGLNQVNAFDEEGWPAALVEVAQKHQAHVVVQFSPSAPLVDPQCVDKIVMNLLDHIHDARFSFSAGPVGLFAEAYTLGFLVDCARQQASLRNGFAWKAEERSKTQPDPARENCHFTLDSKIHSVEGRFTVDSPFEAQWLEHLCERAKNKGEDPMVLSAEAWVDLGESEGLHYPGAREWEWRCHPRQKAWGLACPADDPSQIHNPDVVSYLCQAVEQRRDALLSLLPGDDPLLLPDLPQWCEQFKEAGLYGLHLRTTAHASPDVIGSWLQNCDVITIDFGAPDQKCAALWWGEDRWQQSLTFTEKLRSFKDQCEGNKPMICISVTKTPQHDQYFESFFDHWVTQVDHVMWESHHHYGGRWPDQSDLFFRRSFDAPCRRVKTVLSFGPDGSVPLCRNSGEIISQGLDKHPDDLYQLTKNWRAKDDEGRLASEHQACDHCRDRYRI